MPATTAETFEKRHVALKDGTQVLPRSMISVAALEAGYCLPTPTVNDAVTSTKYPGQMTSEEFIAFCEANQDSFISARDLAKAVVVVAPSNVITRASLEEIFSKSTKPKTTLSEEEVDALFQVLDTENKGAIDAEDFMRALHGEEGVLCLMEQRYADAQEAKARLAKAEEARRAEAEAKRKREAEAAKAKADAEAKAKAEAARRAEEERKKKASACC